MKDLLLCVHVVVKTLNLELFRCHLADYVKELYLSERRTCSMHDYFSSLNQSEQCFLAPSLPLTSSLLKLPFNSLDPSFCDVPEENGPETHVYHADSHSCTILATFQEKN